MPGKKTTGSPAADVQLRAETVLPTRKHAAIDRSQGGEPAGANQIARTGALRDCYRDGTRSIVR